MANRLANSAPRTAAKHSGLALKFISGKYQGGEFPLDDDRTIIIGRSSELDMVLVEEMVSRKHARIETRAGEITIEDLGSTNGTFVNGEKVQTARLREGDRVLIGTSILKVVATSSVTTESQARENLESLAVRRAQVPAREGHGGTTEVGPRMSGNIEEIPLPDLLQLLGTSRKNGVLIIRTESRIGRIFLNQGNVQYALIDGQPQLGPTKSVYRMLAWRRGVFDLDPPDSRRFDEPLDSPVQGLLMEGFRQQDEFEQLLGKLPPMSSSLELPRPLEPPLRDLDEPQLDVLQVAINCSTVQQVLDYSTLTDLDTAQHLLKLIDRGYLVRS